MAAFPELQSGAVAQYPLEHSSEYKTRVLSFVDGSEQRFRQRRAVQRRWLVRLTLLSEGEIATLLTFFTDRKGSYGTFSFRDPWDGRLYENCSFDQDVLGAVFESEGRCTGILTIRENLD
jgi:uncharacterized protein (TIGR02217 family)